MEWDHSSRAKLRAHRIAPWEVRSILAADDWVVVVHPDYPEQVRIIGPTRDGRMLTIALAPTRDATVWRPVTGWRTTRTEMAYYREQHR